MKKSFIILMFTFSFTISAFCTRDFIEGIDYTVDFHEKSPEMAATLHVNFVGVVPEPSEAEKIVKQKLGIYGNKLIASNKVMRTEKKETRYKNIIGSAWKTNITDPANPIKIKFTEDLAAYVWLGKTKSIVPFPDYIVFLKKEQKDFKKKQQLNKSKEKD
ncbi:MAG: hypothetical protein LBJ98_01755 [Endomicrobium sp.]|jgi:hypothetical protein|nr:hypothetical protein [Endomicrobium sp.]